MQCNYWMFFSTNVRFTSVYFIRTFRRVGRCIEEYLKTYLKKWVYAQMPCIKHTRHAHRCLCVCGIVIYLINPQRQPKRGAC